jgi:hypothetical protein
MTKNKGIAMIENSQAIWKYAVRQSTKLTRWVISLEKSSLSGVLHSTY